MPPRFRDATEMRSTSLEQAETDSTAEPGGGSDVGQPRVEWPCRLLIVEQDDGVRANLAAKFSQRGYEVDTANGVQEVLQLQLALHCHIVIAGWKSSNMDGLLLCQQLRRAATKGYVYIVLLSERGSRRDALAGLAAGADDYIEKDTPGAELAARIDAGARIMQVAHSLREGCRESRRLSVTDELTGSHNRRYLTESLPSEIARAQRYSHPLAVLSCDIDLFKRVNDQFGHAAGDDVLREFAARSQSCLRNSVDWMARSGGEEFVIVLPETDLHGAACVAEKLRGAVSGHAIPTCAGHLTITMSVGATAAETPDEIGSASLTDLLRAADRCLYVSKRLGRDRVTAMSSSRAVKINLEMIGRVRN
jgi:two-component system cell cycle response regulator